MYEPFDETAAQVLLAVTPGESIRQVAHRLHTPYETVRQIVNELEDAGYLRYDDGLFVTSDHIREAARDLLAMSAAVNPPSIEEAYVFPQFGDWPFAFTRVDAVYVWTHGGYQVGLDVLPRLKSWDSSVGNPASLITPAVNLRVCRRWFGQSAASVP